MRCVNQDYLNAAADAAFIPKPEGIIAQLCLESLQKFRLAGQGVHHGPRPARKVNRARLSEYFDPLPV
jgi:sulfite dehydrogenase (quinone) subunit SoeA